MMLAALMVSCSNGKDDGAAWKPGTGGAAPEVDFDVPDKDGMTVKGVVWDSSTGKAMPDVVVSDGRLCTITDEKGRYWLATDLSTQRFVFVSTPSGYEIPVRKSSYCFNGYETLDIGTEEVQQFDFSLKPVSGASDRYQVLFCGDPQISSNQKGSHAAYEDVVNSLIKYKDETDLPLYIINLGDVTFDDADENAVVKQYLGRIGIPTMNIPGNHDQFCAQNTNYPPIVDESYSPDYRATAYYCRDFGPNNYSVNIGKIHYIFIDNIFWWGNNWAEEKNGFDEEVLSFIENDLRYVDKNTPLMIMTHSPSANDVIGPDFRQWMLNYDKFIDLLAGYDVMNWSGHLHISGHYVYDDDDMAKIGCKALSLESHVVSRCAGALYIDCEITSDGVPRGFIIMDVDGKKTSWTYRRTRIWENGNDQMQIYTPEDTEDGYVYANVFLHDNTWGTPQWYENGELKGRMQLYTEKDPMYQKEYDKYVAAGSPDPAVGKPGPYDTRHLFRIRPSDGCTSGEVRVTDRFGKEWTQTCTW